MPFTPYSFESPKLLVQHAREDLGELIAIGKKIFTTTSHDNIVDRDPQTGHKRFKVKYTGQIPSRARYVGSNVLNNLRHALDQALVASAEALTGRSCGKIYFPFANSPSDLNGRLRSDAYKDLPVSLHPILNALQPYPSGQGYVGGNDFLCAVTKVVGPNKHQITLNPGLDMGPEFRLDTLAVTSGQVYRMDIPPVWDITNGEAILATGSDDLDIKYDFKVMFHIAFGDAGPMFRHPVIPVLHKFASEAERIVLGLEAETNRILASGSGGKHP